MFFFLRKEIILKPIKRYFHSTHGKTGYIVLIPEIGEDVHAGDSIVKPNGLPAFKDITIENCLGAIGQQSGALEKTVKNIEEKFSKQNVNMSLTNIFHELDEINGPLDTTWGIAKALYLGNSTLIPTKTYMNIHERARLARGSKYNSKTFFNLLTNTKFSKISENEFRLLQKYQLEGKLNGLLLETKQYEELREVIVQLGKEKANFKNKTNIAVHTFAHLVNDFELVRDFPTTLLEATAKDPSHPLKGPWKITLQPQIVEGFLKYCPDRSQRWNIWQANVCKASLQLDKNLENSTHLEKIRALRQRQANLLGYQSYAAMSMETKMVQSVDNLKNVLSKLLKHAGPAQTTEIEQLQSFAEGCGFEHKLNLYDVSYWQRKYLISQLIDEETLREYFPLPNVFYGLFKLSEKLFNIKIIQSEDAEVWQPTVQFYYVYDCDISTNKPVGGFYVDCYSKENKFGKNNGWTVSIRNRNEACNLTPLAALIFNFTMPIDDKPYLLNFNDLVMVFKTFGTAMQHILTKATFTDLAGLSNIEWDASQVSANVMNNFLGDINILKEISVHYSNGEPLPDNIAKKMSLLKTHLAGYNLCQDLYFAHLDIELHSTNAFWLDVVKKLWPVYHIMPLDKKDAHPCSMVDIFSGDWAAAQFSNLYSKIIAADICEAFKEDSSDITVVGKRFKNTFLALGGSVPAAEVFRRFRGRDPCEDAILKLLNIYNSSQTAGNS